MTIDLQNRKKQAVTYKYDQNFKSVFFIKEKNT